MVRIRGQGRVRIMVWVRVRTRFRTKVTVRTSVRISARVGWEKVALTLAIGSPSRIRLLATKPLNEAFGFPGLRIRKSQYEAVVMALMPEQRCHRHLARL